MKEITISYQDYLPSDLITDFIKSLDGLKVPVKENKIESQKRFYNFEGPEIHDLIVFINQHQTELVVGLFGAASYDIIKYGIRKIWIGISKLIKNRLYSTGKKEKEDKSILFIISDENKRVEIVFKGDVSEDQADKIIDKLFDFITSETLSRSYLNPDFHPKNEDVPTIKLIFNKETDTWEPENFGERRRKMDELMKEARRRFRS